MAKLSVVIPSRNERFLVNTINDLLTKAAGEIEVIPCLDGYDPELPEDPRVRRVRLPKASGMRACTNAGASVATGDWLMKCDAHCLFSEGFDEVLKRDCEDNWLMVPRRKRLDAEHWCIEDPDRQPIDYHYLNCPTTNPDYYNFHGVIDQHRGVLRQHILVDETMSFQGSCWFMSRKHWDRLGGMPEMGYSSFPQEPQQLGNQTWLGPWDGRVVVNKRCYYAHLHKGKRYGRGYSQDRNELRTGHEWSAKYWMGNKWEKRAHDFEWLVDRFWPVPTWPDNWRELDALIPK